MRPGRLILATLASFWLSGPPAATSGDSFPRQDRPTGFFDNHEPGSRSTTQIVENSRSKEELFERVIGGVKHSRNSALSPTEFMVLGADAEPWLPRYIDELKKSRPPYAVPETVALIDGQGGARYLVLDWTGLGGREWDSFHGTFLPLEIHKVIRTEQGGLRLKWLRSFDYASARLFPPTGQVVFPGEAPIALIFVWLGGSHPENHGFRLIQMKRNSVDITPDWAGRTEDIADLDGDGVYEVVASDDRWRGFFESGNLGPYLPVILSRSDGRFIHACRRFAKLYRRRLELIKKWAERPAFAQHTHQMVGWSEAFLTHIQIGEFEEARRDLAMLTAYAEVRPPYGMTPLDVRNAFEPVLIEAMTKPDHACPVSGTKFRRRLDGSVTSFSRHFSPEVE